MGSLPDAVYLNEIPKLKAYKNIRTLGYVATNYAGKDLTSLLAEIDTWARLPVVTNNTKLRVDGIFFDETPSTYTSYKYDYLRTASQAVKNGTRFHDRFVGMCAAVDKVKVQTPLTSHFSAVHNPGLVAPQVLNSKTVLQQSYVNLSDVTVVFEETFDKFLQKDNFDALQAHNIKRSKMAVILHSLPVDLSTRVLDFVVDQVGDAADWMFLTDVATKNEYYHSFSKIFADVVKLLDGGS